MFYSRKNLMACWNTEPVPMMIFFQIFLHALMATYIFIDCSKRGNGTWCNADNEGGAGVCLCAHSLWFSKRLWHGLFQSVFIVVLFKQHFLKKKKLHSTNPRVLIYSTLLCCGCLSVKWDALRAQTNIKNNKSNVPLCSRVWIQMYCSILSDIFPAVLGGMWMFLHICSFI